MNHETILYSFEKNVDESLQKINKMNELDHKEVDQPRLKPGNQEIKEPVKKPKKNTININCPHCQSVIQKCELSRHMKSIRCSNHNQSESESESIVQQLLIRLRADNQHLLCKCGCGKIFTCPHKYRTECGCVECNHSIKKMNKYSPEYLEYITKKNELRKEKNRKATLERINNKLKSMTEEELEEYHKAKREYQLEYYRKKRENGTYHETKEYHKQYYQKKKKSKESQE